MATAIEGMDTIPQQIAKRFGDLFTKYLPGWSINGIYNFQAGAAFQPAAAQLQLLMHNGAHPWINDTLTKLLMDLKTDPAYAGKQTRYLAALVNFMYEANGTQVRQISHGRHTHMARSEHAHQWPCDLRCALRCLAICKMRSFHDCQHYEEV